MSNGADDQQRLRWRVGELVLAIGGSNVLTQFFAALPSSADAKYAPEELAGYATRIGQMTPAQGEQMRPLLHSQQWYLRVIALRYFERKGTQTDIAAMQALTTNNAVCKGPDRSWQPGYTVGKVAESAIADLRSLLQQPNH